MTPREFPEEVRRRFGAAGRGNDQSPDDEPQIRLTEPVSRDPVDAQVLLEQFRRRREALGQIDLSDATIRKLRDEGRR